MRVRHDVILDITAFPKGFSCVVPALAEALQQLRARGAVPGRLIRFEVPLAAAEPLAWLGAQAGLTQYYWSDREGEFEMAGVGEADIVSPQSGSDGPEEAFARIRTRLVPEIPSLRYYGGFRFRPGPTKGSLWREFQAFRFIVPRFELIRRPGGAYFVCNVLDPGPEGDSALLDTVSAELTRLRPPRSGTPPLPHVHSRTDEPDRVNWDKLIARALWSFQSTPLEKAVLARETRFISDGPIDPVALLERLEENTEQSFAFCFHPAPDRAFIGASPERLYRRINTYVQSEAIAATRPRGRTDEEDRRLGAELFADEKSRREQAYVAEMLRRTFGQMCRCVQMEEGPSLLRLRNVQHLRTGIEGLLDAPDDAALIGALHPTPAVGGVPRDTALRWIDEHESFDRGIYASPVGWVGPDAAEFCVGIRSGLVQRDSLVLYNGAGIVAGSRAEEEWNELENKMANFLQVLLRND